MNQKINTMKKIISAIFAFILIFYFTGCKKILDNKVDKLCFIPYIDFMAYNVNPDSLTISFRSIIRTNGTITYHRWDTNGVLLYQTANPITFATPPFNVVQPTGVNTSKLYIIKYTARNECGEAYWTDSVTIGPCVAKPLFTKQHLNDSTVRYTNTTSSAASPVVQYRWDFTGNNTNFDFNMAPPLVYYPVDGNYTVLLRVQNACGYNTFWDTVTICRKVSAAQQITLFSTCSNYKFDASASKYGYTYKWDFGDGTPVVSQVNNPVIFHQFNAVGNYTVKLSITNLSGCDTKTLTSNIVVNTVNVAITGQPNFTSDDLAFNFNPLATQSATNFNWSFTDGTSYSFLSNNILSKVFAQPGLYSGKYKAVNTCSSDSVVFSLSAPVTKALSNMPTNNFQAVAVINPAQVYYLGSNGFFYLYNPQNDTWTNYGNIPITIDANTKLSKDRNNDVWVYGTNGAAKWTGIIWLTYLSSALNYPTGTRLIDIDFDNVNNLWTCGTNNQLHRWGDTVLSGYNFTSIVFATATNRIWFIDPINYNNRLAYFSLSTNALGFGPLVSNMSGASSSIEVDNLTNNLYFSSANGFIKCDFTGSYSAYFNSSLFYYLGKPDKIAFDSEDYIWCLFKTNTNREFIRLQKNSSSPDPKLYNNVPEINFTNDFGILNLSGTDNDIFLAKNTGNAAIRIY